MQKFYSEVAELEVLRRDKNIVFFMLTIGYKCHSQILALCSENNLIFLRDKSIWLCSEQSQFHHVVFNISLVNYEVEKRRLESLGLKANSNGHAGRLSVAYIFWSW